MRNFIAEFSKHARELYGPDSEGWIHALPNLLDRCAERFSLRLEEPFTNLSWNLVLPALRLDGSRAVLKVSFEQASLRSEVNALKMFTSRGGVKVLEWDETLGAVLLEQVLPGTPLSSIADDFLSTKNFCEVFRRLHNQTIHKDFAATFPTLREHFASLERYIESLSVGGKHRPLPDTSLGVAADCLADLLDTTTETVLLHGDLHHGNILRGSKGDWSIIDPKGIVGDIHFEPIQYLLNYEERGGDKDFVLTNRIRMISEELNLNPRRIALWGVARGALEACWSLESGGDWTRGIELCERFRRQIVQG